MNIQHLYNFMWVYEERSFSKAAEKARLHQPALSMQIRKVEERFGVELFARKSNGVLPTPAAHLFYERCRNIAREFEMAHRELAESSKAAELSGQLRVGLPGFVNKGILRQTLVPFLERHPSLEISILEGYTGTLIDWVKEGRIDFALGIRPSEDAHLVQRLVYRDRVVLVSKRPINGPTATPCDLAQLEAMQLIIPDRQQSFGGAVRQYIEQGLIRASRILEINGAVGAAEMSRNTDWCVLTPFTAVCREAESPDVFIYPVAKPDIPFLLYLVYDPRRPLSRAARELFESIMSEFLVVDRLWERFVAPTCS